MAMIISGYAYAILPLLLVVKNLGLLNDMLNKKERKKKEGKKR